MNAREVGPRVGCGFAASVDVKGLPPSSEDGARIAPNRIRNWRELPLDERVLHDVYAQCLRMREEPEGQVTATLDVMLAHAIDGTFSALDARSFRLLARSARHELARRRVLET